MLQFSLNIQFSFLPAGSKKKRFDNGKQSTTYVHLVENLCISKAHAQRILKRAQSNKIVFAPTNKKPQEYYPSSKHFQVIEHLDKKNVPVSTTGSDKFNYPLCYLSEQTKADNFLQSLLFAKYISRQVHKLLLELVIDKKKLLENGSQTTA